MLRASCAQQTIALQDQRYLPQKSTHNICAPRLSCKIPQCPWLCCQTTQRALHSLSMHDAHDMSMLYLFCQLGSDFFKLTNAALFVSGAGGRAPPPLPAAFWPPPWSASLQAC